MNLINIKASYLKDKVYANKIKLPLEIHSKVKKGSFEIGRDTFIKSSIKLYGITIEYTTLVVGIILVFLLTFFIFFYGLDNKNTILPSSLFFFHKVINYTTVVEPIDDAYNKIYIYVNFLAFFTNNYMNSHYKYHPVHDDFENIKLNIVENMISKSLERANEHGITNIMLSEKHMSTSKRASLEALRLLVYLSPSYNITIGLLLYEEFSIRSQLKTRNVNSGKYVIDYLRKVSSDGELLTSFWYLYSLGENETKYLIHTNVLRFIKYGIQEFYFGHNPYLFKDNVNSSNGYTINNKIDYNLLKERSKTILSIGDNMKLFYLYDNAHTHNKIKESNLKYEGAMFRVTWSVFKLRELNVDLLESIFRKLDSERKIVLFEIALYSYEHDLIKILIGLYIFSPVPIIFEYDQVFAPVFLQHIFTDETLIRSEKFLTINTRFSDAIKLKNSDSFFKQSSKLFGDIEYKNGIISAIRRSSYPNNFYQFIFLLYNKSNVKVSVDLNKCFNIYSFNTFNILYDSSTLNIKHTKDLSGLLTIYPQQILIIRPILRM